MSKECHLPENRFAHQTGKSTTNPLHVIGKHSKSGVQHRIALWGMWDSHL